MISITAACDSEAEVMKPPLKPKPLLECHFNLRTGDGFPPGKGLQAQNIIAREDEQKIKEGRQAGRYPTASRVAVQNGLRGNRWMISRKPTASRIPTIPLKIASKAERRRSLRTRRTTETPF
jgi:hypothetical protein